MKHNKNNNEANFGALTLVRKYFPKVTSVSDAEKQIVVEVTSGDVRKAKARNENECALAQCLLRTQHADGVIIGLTVSYVVHGKKAIRYHNTETISREITSLDRNGSGGFDAGIYNLSPISPGNRLGVKHGPKLTHANDGTTGKTRKYKHYTQNVRVLRV